MREGDGLCMLNMSQVVFSFPMQESTKGRAHPGFASFIWPVRIFLGLFLPPKITTKVMIIHPSPPSQTHQSTPIHNFINDHIDTFRLHYLPVPFFSIIELFFCKPPFPPASTIFYTTTALK